MGSSRIKTDLFERANENQNRDLADWMKKRNIQTFLLALLLLIAVSAAMPALAEEAPFLGDMTGDADTTAADAACMLRALASGRLSEEERPDLDFTKNGDIDGTDVRAALLYSCGGISDWVAFGERVSSGLCDERLFERFSYTGTTEDALGNYKSDSISVSLSSDRAEDSTYHMAEIYIQDISSFVTAFSSGEFLGSAEGVSEVFDAVPGAIVAMNGDYYSINVYGPVVRNGVAYEDHVSNYWDIAVLQSNGVLDVYPYGVLRKAALLEMNAYQTWVFGPALLDESGLAKTKFRSNVQSSNPRSALGYYEPGHYAFLTVDGRSSESDGMTMEQLSRLCQDLGFSAAYNLDGGQSSVLMTRSGLVNDAYHGGRAVSDILAIRELPEG